MTIQEQEWRDKVARHFEPLRSELVLRGIEDAHVENTGGHVMAVCGTMPNGMEVTATDEGFSFSDARGTLLDAAYATLPDGSADYDALAIVDYDGADLSDPYAGTIHEDSAAFAALVILTTYKGTVGA